MNALSLIHLALLKLQGLVTWVGHEIVWLIIAMLFCIVELAVFLSEIAPKFARQWSGQRSEAAHGLRPATAAIRA